MVLDASAIIAILGREEDAESLYAKIDAIREPICYSPVATYEAVVGLARKTTASADGPIEPQVIESAERIVEEFLSSIGATEIDITTEIRRLAIDACKRFGRAAGHRAKLNMGDCFAYAAARSLGVPLLFKGNDFPNTDIEAA